MKMTLAEIVNRTHALAGISQKKLPIKVSYAIGRNLDRLTKEHSAYDAKRQERCRALAEVDEEGHPVTLKSVIDGMPVESFKLSDESMAQLTAELQELLGMEIDVDVTSITIDQLERIDEDPRYEALSPGELTALEFMIAD